MIRGQAPSGGGITVRIQALSGRTRFQRLYKVARPARRGCASVRAMLVVDDEVLEGGQGEVGPKDWGGTVRLGLVVKKSFGSAVARNRARRVARHAVREAILRAGEGRLSIARSGSSAKRESGGRRAPANLDIVITLTSGVPEYHELVRLCENAIRNALRPAARA